jgi:creatinine amidohydrolase
VRKPRDEPGKIRHTGQGPKTLSEDAHRASGRTGRRFDELTDPDIAAALARSPRVILPMGSVEQHGPHLPTATDFYAATAIALAVAEQIDALVLPLCPLGVTPLHMPFAGTVSLRPQTLQDVVTDIGTSLASHGCREFVILNWHEGNIPSLALVSERLHRDLGMAVVVVQACYVAEEQFGPGAGGLTHGGKIEAWSVLGCRPDLVRLDRAANSGDQRRGELVDRLRRDRSFQPVLSDVRTMSPTGWYGNPVGATEEEGREFVAAVGGEIAVRLEDTLAALAEVQPASALIRAAGRSG